LPKKVQEPIEVKKELLAKKEEKAIKNRFEFYRQQEVVGVLDRYTETLMPTETILVEILNRLEELKKGLL
jgi:hypothetical protein